MGALAVIWLAKVIIYYSNTSYMTHITFKNLAVAFEILDQFSKNIQLNRERK